MSSSLGIRAKFIRQVISAGKRYQNGRSEKIF
jgi:hypothetical protein